MRCQSVMHPSSAEYWHIGAMTMRLTRSRLPTRIGSNSLGWDTGLSAMSRDDERSAVPARWYLGCRGADTDDKLRSLPGSFCCNLAIQPPGVDGCLFLEQMTC